MRRSVTQTSGLPYRRSPDLRGVDNSTRVKKSCASRAELGDTADRRSALREEVVIPNCLSDSVLWLALFSLQRAQARK